MKKRWRVCITRDVTESASVEVMAESAEQANDLALEATLDGRIVPAWFLDDGSEGEPYLSDAESTEAVSDA